MQYYILIHGGNSFGQRLRRQVPFLTFEELNKQNEFEDCAWNLYFKHELTNKGKKALYVIMPYPEEAIYEEWEERINQVFAQLLISSRVYLTGHSLGALALQMYLCRNNVKQTIEQVNFISPTLKEGDFIADQNWGRILDKCKNNHIFHSIDDQVCSYREGVMYNERLIGSKMHTFRQRGHFLDREFPELISHLLDE